MAKIVVCGSAMVVKSEFSLDELFEVQNYCPEALIVKGGEDGKEPVFRVFAGDEGPGDMDKYGALFTGTSHDGENKATITLPLYGIEGDIKEVIADFAGAPLMYINKIEEGLPDVLKDIKKRREIIKDSISLQ